MLGKIWKSFAPTKVIAFSWRLLLDRLPSRMNLLRRRIITDASGITCALCGDHQESSLHLFLSCDVSSRVWYDIFRWLERELVLPWDFYQLYLLLGSFGRNSQCRSGLALIWHSVLWTIWEARNDAIFVNQRLFRDELLEMIQVVSWHWFLARSKSGACLYYEWYMDPLDCLGRIL